MENQEQESMAQEVETGCKAENVKQEAMPAAKNYINQMHMLSSLV